MNLDEVPQEEMHYKGRDKVRKLMYAVDKNGQYTGINSAGWEAENVAMKEAWQEIEIALQETLQRIKSGELSPLAYHMQKHLMDLGLMAKYSGIWKWRVKHHLKPKKFNALSEKTLNKYAAALNICVSELKSVP